MKRFISLAALAAATVSFAAAQTDPGNIFPLTPPSVTTIPSNGDVNPYGVAFVPKTIAPGLPLHVGDVLVSNYNNVNNLQGTGTTIVKIDKAGHQSLFYQSSNTTGLSAALGVLTNGAVLVGSLPTFDGTAATAQPGILSVISSGGQFLGTIGTSGTVNGPWGMAVYDTGKNGSGVAHIFVSNVLSGSISRFDLTYSLTGISASVVTIATGMTHRPDPAALELGPSGLAYLPGADRLYVANSADNSIYTISPATKLKSAVTPSLWTQDFEHLHGPIDISILPNEDLVVANSDGSNVDPNQPSELVQYNAMGQFISEMSIDANEGGAFGANTFNYGYGAFRMAAVDDVTNTLNLWTIVQQ